MLCCNPSGSKRPTRTKTFLSRNLRAASTMLLHASSRLRSLLGKLRHPTRRLPSPRHNRRCSLLKNKKPQHRRKLLVSNACWQRPLLSHQPALLPQVAQVASLFLGQSWHEHATSGSMPLPLVRQTQATLEAKTPPHLALLDCSLALPCLSIEGPLLRWTAARLPKNHLWWISLVNHQLALVPTPTLSSRDSPSRQCHMYGCSLNRAKNPHVCEMWTLGGLRLSNMCFLPSFLATQDS